MIRVPQSDDFEVIWVTAILGYCKGQRLGAFGTDPAERGADLYTFVLPPETSVHAGLFGWIWQYRVVGFFANDSFGGCS